MVIERPRQPLQSFEMEMLTTPAAVVAFVTVHGVVPLMTVTIGVAGMTNPTGNPMVADVVIAASGSMPVTVHVSVRPAAWIGALAVTFTMLAAWAARDVVSTNRTSAAVSDAIAAAV